MYRKVVCPIELKNGRTIWRRTGSAFDNKDGSVTILLDVLPTNGKLQIFEFDERDKERRLDPPNPNSNSNPNPNPANDGVPF